MNLLERFGIEPLLLVAQIVNFGIILFALQRFVYKPVLSMLKKRKDTIEESLKQANETKKLLEEAEEKQDKIIRKAQEHAAKILNDVKSQSKEVALELEEKAKKQAERILEDSRIQIIQETREAEKKLAKGISEMSLSLLEKSLKGLFTKNEEDEIIERALKNIKRSN
ncbi:MAG: ATP synthase F0 subunit B [Candidatus Levybacteria bacterium RBG_16_35_11]|nr:MAG: ATP synthase F0 subunit B [Candidatus Levybacteria bacterium RBG_16_35_11]